jgi:hypothetical protein
MPLHTAPPAPRRTAPRTAPDTLLLDEALEHIGALSERLWAVRRLHAPRVRRNAFGVRRVLCAGCGHALPCPTLRAAAPGRP